MHALIASDSKQGFESIRHVNEDEQEYWLARELSKMLEYSEYRHFLPVIERAKEAVRNSGQPVENHFEDILEMVKIGSGAMRQLQNIKLSRYACYLIVQNGDSSKPVIALGQTYFAVQTRRQELADQQNFSSLSEDQQRLMLRNEMIKHNKKLSAAARDCGVITPLDYAIFQDHGYQGLYGGLRAKDIKARKKLKKSQIILDHMGSTELAANLFRATQTEEVLRRKPVKNRNAANQTHHEVGQKVRKAISDIGGTMPENLPTPDKSIQQLERQQKKVTGK